MFNKKFLDSLKKSAFEIIENEELYNVNTIRFQNRKNGSFRQGNCKFIPSINSYYIIINLTFPKIVKNNVTGKDSYNRINGCVQLPKRTITLTLAHELAHLKFCKHNTQHLSYTNKINKKLLVKLREKNQNFEN